MRELSGEWKIFHIFMEWWQCGCVYLSKLIRLYIYILLILCCMNCTAKEKNDHWCMAWGTRKMVMSFIERVNRDVQFEKKVLLSVWGACATSERRCWVWVEYKDLELRRQILAGDKNMAIISTQMVINATKVMTSFWKTVRMRENRA